MRDDAVGGEERGERKGTVRDWRRRRRRRNERERRERRVVFMAGYGVGERDRCDCGRDLVLSPQTLSCLFYTGGEEEGVIWRAVILWFGRI